MNFRIERRIGIQAPADRIWESLADLSYWSRWNPIERDASGSIGFGSEIRLTETLPGHPARPVIARVGDWQPLAQLVWSEKRGMMFNVVRYFEIDELEPGSCIAANGYIFSGLRGELFHDKHKFVLKRACEQVADALKVSVESRT